MSQNARPALTVIRETLAVAAGYAFIAAVIYAVLFVDLTGGGSFWSTLRHLRGGGQEEAVPSATRVVKVAPVGGVKVHEDRILAVFDDPHEGQAATAEYLAPESAGIVPPILVDASSKAAAGWKPGVKGGLRSFSPRDESADAPSGSR